MSRTKTFANYYRAYPADPSLDVPAESFLGWARTEIDMDFDRTALIVMHAWDYGTIETNPDDYRRKEYLGRMNGILETVFPALLKAARNSELNIFHVVRGLKRHNNYYSDHPNYLATVQLAGPTPSIPIEHIEPDPIIGGEALSELCWGKQNRSGPRWLRNFPKVTVPEGLEPIAEDDHQLFALCKKFNVNHLVYTGFLINACLRHSAGGIFTMLRRGLLCSAIREAVTAWESKESARKELNKESELCSIAHDYGYVFDLDDFLEGLKRWKDS